MNIEAEILEMLENPSMLDSVEKDTDYIKQINSTLLDVYKLIAPNKKVEFAREAGAFALAKAMENQLLNEIRPEDKHFWLVIMEIAEGAKFNLPPHLEDKLYDYMDAAENAIESFINNNLFFDFEELLTALQAVGTILVDKHNLKDLTFGGLTNDKIMTRDEFHNFCLQGAIRALQEREYEILKVNLGSAQPVSIICRQGGVTYHTAVTGALLPKTGELGGWKLTELEKIKEDNKNKIAILGVSIIPANDLYASMGVAIKEGEYNFKVSPLEVINKNKK